MRRVHNFLSTEMNVLSNEKSTPFSFTRHTSTSQALRSAAATTPGGSGGVNTSRLHEPKRKQVGNLKIFEKKMRLKV